MPTVIIGNNTGDDYSGTEDAMIRRNSSVNNFGGSTEFNIQKYNDSQHCNLLIRFTGLSNIPSGITISSALLYLYRNYGNMVTNNIITSRRLLRNWGEGTHDWAAATSGEASWDCYAYPNNWTSAGALSSGNDISSLSGASITLTSGSGYFNNSNNAQFNSEIENICNGSYNNNGHLWTRTDGENDSTYNNFTSSEGTDGRRPYLSVTYTESGGGSSLPSIINNHRQQGAM